MLAGILQPAQLPEKANFRQQAGKDKKMRRFLALICSVALVATLAVSASASPNPRLTPGEGGGASAPHMCMVASSTDVPAHGSVLVGDENFSVLYRDGQKSQVQVGTEGHIPQNAGLTLLREGESNVPPCSGNGSDATSNFCFVQTEQELPRDKPCAFAG